VKKETAEALSRLSREEYDAYASEFSNSRQFFWRELEFLKKYVREGETVLDVGCGNGRLLNLFGDTTVKYTGVDFSKELIAIAEKNHGEKGTFLHADARSLPFADNSFDVVFSIAVIHHLPARENREQFVSEITRVLKPGGVCVVTSWNILQWRFARVHAVHFLKKLAGLSPLDFGDLIITFGKEKKKRYVHALRKKSLRVLFEKNNLDIISLEEVKRKSGFANLVVMGRKR
jgi:ubiquinone/menaquinone biosynthesis C-methylase UbiE